MYNQLSTEVVYIPAHSKAVQLSNRLYRKELIPVGAFVKDDGNERIEFEVDDSVLQHWQKTFNDMKFSGIEVPMPLEHSEDPEKRRGTLLDIELGKNDEGQNAAFGIFKFRDEQAEKDLKDADVSIYVPPVFRDGKGRTYVRPIRHVAFTDYPVIPKLGKSQLIAASYSAETSKKLLLSKGKSMADEEEKESDKGEKESDKESDKGGKEKGGKGSIPVSELRKLASKLGITDEVPDDKLMVALNHLADVIMSDEDEEDDDDDDEDEDDDDEDEDEDEPKAKNKEKEKGGNVKRSVKHEETEYHEPPISAGFIKMARKTRMQELDALVLSSRITPATRDKLAKQYCSDDALQLGFSSQFESLDNFDSILEALKDNDPVNLQKEKTADQGTDLAFSFKDLEAKNNPLIADAERRAKSAGFSD